MTFFSHTKNKYRIEALAPAGTVDAKLYGGPAGYKFRYTLRDPQNGGAGVNIEAIDPTGKKAGRFNFWDDGTPEQKYIQPEGVGVDEEHRRKGLATAAYVLAEKVTGKKILKDDSHGSMTDEAKKLWNQPNRPFGVDSK